MPTESSYGLAADPISAAGVAAIFSIKRRAPDEALPVLIAGVSQLERLGASRDSEGLSRVAPLWPAPLTLIVALERPIAASAGASSLAVRVPAHDRLRRLIAELDAPITATSANRSGRPPLCEPARVAELLAGTDGLVVDDGPLAGGPPSTLVRWNADRAGFDVLREGAYPPHLLRNTSR